MATDNYNEIDKTSELRKNLGIDLDLLKRNIIDSKVYVGPKGSRTIEKKDGSDTPRNIPDLVYNETLSDEEMKELIDYEINKGSDSLYLYNIESLTDNQARMIKENSNIFESVFLPSLNRLTPNQANLLSNIKSLDLRGMKEVSNDVLKELGKGNIETLELRGLEKFTDNQAEILAKSNIKTIGVEPQVLSPKGKDILKDKLS